MKIQKINQLPVDSILNQNKDIFDFVETNYLALKSNNIKLNDLLFSFSKSLPNWLMWMKKFKRNAETVDGPGTGYTEGDRIGPFHLFRLNYNEAVLGMNTKFLDYRVSFLIERENFQLCISTTLTLNNLLAKCHFPVVKTIYRLTTPHILQNISRHL